MRIALLLLVMCVAVSRAEAQELLNRKVSMEITKKPVGDVLIMIEAENDVTFSYNSELFRDDSLISIHVSKQPLSAVLNTIFGEGFKFVQEGQSHIIILPAEKSGELKISGMVINSKTGEPVPYATVYNKKQLIGTLTGADGAFVLILKSRGEADSLSVSRVSYQDTAIRLPPFQNNNIQIKLSVNDVILDSIFVTAHQDWLLKMALPARDLINSVNLKNFFVKQPVQFSVLPGFGSKGKLGSQIENKISINLLGGFNGGVNGLEIGGLYNIVNRNAGYMQAAGLFNYVGDTSKGVQIAGLFNKDKSMEGFQASGIFNDVQFARGVQIAGIYNDADTVSGFQIASGFNRVSEVKGIQIAGAFNQTDSSSGFQIAGIFNKNRRFKGIQIAPVNIADTMEGYSIGLVNLGNGAYHQLSLSVNETGVQTIAFKSGNPLLYSIVLGGMRFNQNQKLYSFGFGVGRDQKINLNNLVFNPELTSVYYYNGNWAKSNISWRVDLNMKYKISQKVSLFAGPSFSFLFSKPGIVPDGYKADISNGAHNIKIGKSVNGWIGWSAGVNLF